MKVVGIILIILQILSLLGGLPTNPGGSGYGIGFYLGYFLPGIIGVILLIKANKKKEQKNSLNNVVFFCPNCGSIHEGTPGEAQGCPACHNPAAETEMLWTDWTSRSEEEQAYIRNYWLSSVQSQ